MMVHRTFNLSILSFALLLACFLHVETTTLRRGNRALRLEEQAPLLELTSPSVRTTTKHKPYHADDDIDLNVIADRYKSDLEFQTALNKVIESIESKQTSDYTEMREVPRRLADNDRGMIEESGSSMSMSYVYGDYSGTKPQPNFDMTIIDDRMSTGRTLSYWVQSIDVNSDGFPDLLTYGCCAEGNELEYWENPGPGGSWPSEPTILATLNWVVAVDTADIDGDGDMDFAITKGYGENLNDLLQKDGGDLVWLENPGDGSTPWNVHSIGKWISMHRVELGYFTQTDKVEAIGMPIVGAVNNVYADFPIILYQQPSGGPKTGEDGKWQETTFLDKYFHAIHDAQKDKFTIADDSDLDSLVISSLEGITWLWWDGSQPAEIGAPNGRWQVHPIGLGELRYWKGNMPFGNPIGGEPAGVMGPFRGSGNSAVCKTTEDMFSFIPAGEPLHGNILAVYTKEKHPASNLPGGAPNRINQTNWLRTVHEEYTPGPNMGGIHHILCADFDNDGNDEFVVGASGAGGENCGNSLCGKVEPIEPGLFYYHFANSQLAKTKLSSESTARIAIDDFDGDGCLDIATIGYHATGYYEDPSPKVVLYTNKMCT